MFGIEPEVAGLHVSRAGADVISLVNGKTVEPRRNA